MAIISATASQSTGVSIFCSTVCSGADKKTKGPRHSHSVPQCLINYAPGCVLLCFVAVLLQCHWDNLGKYGIKHRTISNHKKTGLEANCLRNSWHVCFKMLTGNGAGASFWKHKCVISGANLLPGCGNRLGWCVDICSYIFTYYILHRYWFCKTSGSFINHHLSVKCHQ